jgi:hypothetical protein
MNIQNVSDKMMCIFDFCDDFCDLHHHLPFHLD